MVRKRSVRLAFISSSVASLVISTDESEGKSEKPVGKRDGASVAETRLTFIPRLFEDCKDIARL
jgi:hypothetical protein